MTTTGSTIIPSLRYRDAPRMIDWLCDAFGFVKHAVYADGAVVHHARLVIRGYVLWKPLHEPLHRLDLLRLRGAVLLGPARDLPGQVVSGLPVVG